MRLLEAICNETLAYFLRSMLAAIYLKDGYILVNLTRVS